MNMLETLERRMMLDASAELVGDANRSPADPESAWLGDDLLFAADDGSGDVELWRTDGTAAGTVRVRDIRSAGSSLPRDFTTVGDEVFFTAYEDATGRELWKTDGTTAGTMLVADIRPGPVDSGYSFNPSPVTSNGLLFFVADDGDSGRELWRSDGTQAGTFLVKDINPGPDDSSPWYFTMFQDQLLFRAHNADGGELWETDGTEEGTRQVTDLPEGSGSFFYGMVEHKGSLYFSTYNSPALWKYDGETLEPLVEVNSRPSGMVSVADHLYFTVTFGPQASELWRTDGTATGTVQLQLSNLPTGQFDESSLTAMGDVLLFVAKGQRFVDETQHLWRTDGTDEGTVRLTPRVYGGQRVDSVYMERLGSTLYFVISDSNARRHELWRTEGMPNGTERVETFASLSSITTSAAGDALYIVASHQDTGREVFRIDTTGQLTAIEILPGAVGSDSQVLGEKGETVLLWAGGEQGLWQANVRTNEIERVKDALTGATESAFSNYFGDSRIVSIGDYLLFNGGVFRLFDTGGNNSQPIYRLDRTTNEISPLRPFDSSPNGQYHVAELTTLTDVVYYVLINDGEAELWRTDGTDQGTVRVPMSESFDGIRGLTVAGDALLFVAQRGLNDFALMRTDGTPEGTYRLASWDSADTGKLPADASLTTWRGGVYFYVETRSTSELWVTDGSPEGTRRVLADLPQDNSRRILPTDDQLFLFLGGEVWVTDGTLDGSRQVSSSVDSLMLFDGKLVYLNPVDADGERDEIWMTDGTAAGTVRFWQADGMIDGMLGATEDLLFFLATGDDGNNWLWRTDGTTEGTVELRAWNGGCGGWGSSYPADAGGRLFFNTTSEEHGCELWSSDGTVVGTKRVTDISPGSGDSSPKYKTEIDGQLYFAADDGFHGMELFRLPLADAPAPIAGDSNGDGIFNSADLVMVFQRGEYEDAFANNSTFGDGDWNGDGEFDSADLVFAFQEGSYVAQARVLDPVDLVFVDDTETEYGRKTKQKSPTDSPPA